MCGGNPAGSLCLHGWKIPDGGSGQAFLFPEIPQDIPAGIQICGERIFIHIVQQIKIEIFYIAFSQLFLEDRFRIIGAADLVSGVFCGQEVFFPRISGEGLGDDDPL